MSFVYICGYLQRLTCVFVCSLRCIPFDNGRIVCSQKFLFHTAAHIFNGRESARRYHIAFPDGIQPSHPNIVAVCRRIAEKGSAPLQTMDRARPRSSCTSDHKESILEAVKDYPVISTRRMILACRTSHSNAWRYFKSSSYDLKLCRVFRHLITHHGGTFANGLLNKHPLLFLQSCLRMRQNLKRIK